MPKHLADMIPKFDGCGECERLHETIESAMMEHHDNEHSGPPPVHLLTELTGHIQSAHAAEMELARVEAMEFRRKALDHNSNPLVKALDEMDEEREPVFDGDSTKCGLATVKPDKANAWVTGFLDHLQGEVYPASMAAADWTDSGFILHMVLSAAFYGGVYAERNRMLSEPIAL